jgi:hypothetical protein
MTDMLRFDVVASLTTAAGFTVRSSMQVDSAAEKMLSKRSKQLYDQEMAQQRIACLIGQTNQQSDPTNN